MYYKAIHHGSSLDGMNHNLELRAEINFSQLKTFAIQQQQKIELYVKQRRYH